MFEQQKFKNLSVAIIGETITDEFIPVKYQGQSMKSFCPVFEKVIISISSFFVINFNLLDSK